MFSQDINLLSNFCTVLKHFYNKINFLKKELFTFIRQSNTIGQPFCNIQMYTKKAQSLCTHTVIQHIITHTTYMQLQRWMKLTEHAEEADDTEETAGESEKERFQSVKLWDSSRSSYATVRLKGSSAHIPFQHALLNMRCKEHKQIQIHPIFLSPLVHQL